MTISSSAAFYAQPDLPRDNCSRVDFVKGVANELKLRLSVSTSRGTDGAGHARAEAKLDALNEAIKSGDSRKAEAALASARSILDAPPSPPLAPQPGHFQAWA